MAGRQVAHALTPAELQSTLGIVGPYGGRTKDSSIYIYMYREIMLWALLESLYKQHALSAYRKD